LERRKNLLGGKEEKGKREVRDFWKVRRNPLPFVREENFFHISLIRGRLEIPVGSVSEKFFAALARKKKEK